MHTNNTPAFEAVYDTNNTVLCDVRTGPASLGLSLDRVSMGQAFRSIDVTLRVLGAHGALTIYHLMLPPGSPPPSIAAIKTYDDKQMLTSGRAARGRFHARAGEKRMRYAIDHSQCPSPPPHETGLIDGYRYDCYFYAEDAFGSGSYIVRYKDPVMAMPFHLGRGTARAPFCIRELEQGELGRYPDLMPGHPLNSAGVAQSARMLDNIGRLQALYASSGGVHGLKNALSLSYSLQTPIDLEGYRRAYGGRGWRPIGCFDEHARAFSGRLTGGGITTPIRNMTLTPGHDGAVRETGLFCALEKALVSDIAIQGADIFLMAGGAGDAQAHHAGALSGSVKNSALNRIRLERILILAASAAPDCIVRIGGLSGYAAGSVSLRDCRAKRLLIADFNARASASGGLFGELSCFAKRSMAILEDITLSDARLFGRGAVGGAIGFVRGAAAVRRIALNELALDIESSGAGGFVGIWQSLSAFKPQRLETVTVSRLSVSAPGARTAQSGGLIGGLTVNSPMKISGCTVTQSRIDCACACGGLLGMASSAYEGYLTVEDCAAQAHVSGAYMIGGLAGALHSAGLVLRCHAAGGGVRGVLALGGFVGHSAYMRYQGCEAVQPVRPYRAFALIQGGFVGLSEMSAFEDCHAKGDVDTLLGFSGGFAGIQAGGAGEQLPAIDNRYHRCSARGEIRGLANGVYAAMLGGFMGAGTLFLLRECYASGAVKSRADIKGGLVAGIFCGAGCLVKPIIEDCYSVSSLQGAGAALAGGLVGRADYCAIRRCFYSGAIHADYPAGGFIARGCDASGAVEISGCLLLGGSLRANQGAVNRCMAENADAAILTGNFASASFQIYDGGADAHVIDDPDGPDGQTIDDHEVPWFLINALHWDTERIWTLKSMRSQNRPLLIANTEC